MATGLHLWSKTTGSNDAADSSVNWREGQAPSSVNDSARAMMARIAEWRDDLGGIATGGTSTAFTVTTNRGFGSAAVMDKQIVTIIPHTTNGADATLAVDGLTARQIRTATGVNVSSGILVQGTPYQLVYVDASTEFILLGFTANPYNIPIGAGMIWLSSVAPNSSFAFPFGQAISRTTYSSLFGLSGFGTAYGVGDGSTTFNMPDVRGRSIFGVDNMGGSAAGRLTTATMTSNGLIGATGGVEFYTMARNQLPNVQLDTQLNSGAVTVTVSDNKVATLSGGSGGAQFHVSGSNPLGITASGVLNDLTGFTSYLSGGASSQQATANMPPAIALPFVVRII